MEMLRLAVNDPPSKSKVGGGGGGRRWEAGLISASYESTALFFRNTLTADSVVPARTNQSPYNILSVGDIAPYCAALFRVQE